MTASRPACIAVLREGSSKERRVSATPESVRNFKSLGAIVIVEREAGVNALIDDSEFKGAGAIIACRQSALREADIVLAVNAPIPLSLAGVKPGTRLIGNLEPTSHAAWIAGYAELGIEALALDLMPDIPRARPMDTRSSQASIEGYCAVLEAAQRYCQLPPLMTRGGMLSAARVFVMGGGEAGQQAIATARLLGAHVSATDLHASGKKRILAAGAKPFCIGHLGDRHGRPAKTGASLWEHRNPQAHLFAAHIAKQDIIIAATIIPGMSAPRLISEAQIATMKPGSVIFDLAAEYGGNVEGSELDKVVRRHGVFIIARSRVTSCAAGAASMLFARNLFNFIETYWDEGEEGLVLPLDDEIVRAIRLTHERRVVRQGLLPQFPNFGDGPDAPIRTGPQFPVRPLNTKGELSRTRPSGELCKCCS